MIRTDRAREPAGSRTKVCYRNLKGSTDTMGKRIAAWAGIIILVLLYVSTLVLAIAGNDSSMPLFKLSIVMTVIVPVFLYIYIKMFDVMKNRKPLDNEDQLITFDNRAPVGLPEEESFQDEEESLRDEVESLLDEDESPAEIDE